MGYAHAEQSIRFRQRQVSFNLQKEQKKPRRIIFMNMSHEVRIALLLIGLLILTVGGFLVIRSGRDESHSASTSLPDLEYLKAVNTVGSPQDPELMFLLMTAYVN